MTMTFSALLSGCGHPGGEWFEQNDIQKVIDGLKEIFSGKRAPELAKVHISVAEIGEAGQELYEIKNLSKYCPKFSRCSVIKDKGTQE